MDKQNKRVTETQIGDTLYIVETVISPDAKETAHDKIKRMIMNELDRPPKVAA